MRHGAQGSAEDRAQLGTFDEALAALESGRYDGVGFAMLPDAGLVGIDLDHCLDDQGNPSRLAAEILNAGDTYAEISPSGKGLRLFYFGALPDKKNHGAGVELFHGAGFLTVTGNRINDADIEDLSETRKARLLELVGATESSYKKRRDWSAEAGPGQRYDALNAFLWGHLVAPNPLPAHEIWQRLVIYNATHCNPPHPEDELKRIWTQGLADLEKKQPEAYRRLMRASSAAEGGPLGVDIIDFIANYASPDGVVDGIVQRNYLHAISSLTNHGKTAVGTTMILAVATGRPFAGREVQQGLVYVLCGENPFDFMGRLIGAMQELGIDQAEVKGRVRVVGQAFPLTAQIERIKAEIQAWGDVVLVFVDTSVAYFSGDDEDSNVEARAHAQTLREFTLLPSRPAVVVACHPVKNATRDNLVPRGGSAFLNEIDTNLTVWAEDEVATLHWHRKIRGAPFEPVQFRLVRKVIEGSKNAKGKPGTAGVAVPIAEQDAEALARRDWHDENRLLDAMLRHPKDVDCRLGARLRLDRRHR